MRHHRLQHHRNRSEAARHDELTRTVNDTIAAAAAVPVVTTKPTNKTTADSVPAENPERMPDEQPAERQLSK